MWFLNLRKISENPVLNKIGEKKVEVTASGEQSKRLGT